MGRHPSVHVTGAGGQVGLELGSLLPEARLHARTDLDVTDEAAVRAALQGAGVVVHLAAFTNVDQCQSDPDRAFSVNGRGTEHVVEAVRHGGGRVVYVSTDYVFDGTKKGEYVESDRPSPVNVYGESKLRGERAALSDEHNLVLRTSWVYGTGRNFVATMVRAARAGRDLRVVDDQVGRPTSARDLALALAHLVESDATGTLHVAGDGEPASWADLATEALDAAGVAVAVNRVSTVEYARAAHGPLAPRPPNSTLSIDAARALGVPLSDWRESVRAYVRGAS